MAKKRFSVVANVSSESPSKIRPVLDDLFPAGSVKKTEGGYAVNSEMLGESARDLNRELLSSLRKVEKKTRLRAEWTSGKITEKFFDYVPKGKRKV